MVSDAAGGLLALNGEDSGNHYNNAKLWALNIRESLPGSFSFVLLAFHSILICLTFLC